MAEKNAHSWIFKTALLSISVLAMTAPSVAVANPLMEKVFTQQSTPQIEMISTLPNLGVLLLIMFSTLFAKKLGIKRTVMLGLIMYLVGGIVPVMVTNYWVIIIFRFIMGCGIGLFNPFSVSLMYDFYQKEELADMLGYQNTAQNMGNAGFGLLLGVLVIFGWKAAFSGYLISLIPIVMFGLFVKVPSDSQKHVETKETTHQFVSAQVYLLAFLMLIIFGMFMMMTIKLASFLSMNHIATPSVASVILAVMGASSMFASALFGKLNKLIGNFVLPLALIGIAAGFYLVATADAIVVVTIGVITSGIFFGWVFPQAFYRMSQITSKNSGNLSTSIILMGINLGAFLSPTIVNGIAANMFGNDSPGFILLMCAVGFVILAVIEGIYTTVYVHDKAVKSTN